ncbi:hypothetical protein ABFS82_04G095500 [Erythranthe guttata]|uniref:EPIDERMAL PATTERNING FACTOR-like protein 6 isoform X2 n=1 Tax=Erythranthe guttata TaxID=4155 RepID=UPI00064DEF8D|nr:PREDICTED: EPIDERMAL PATTERNING FACTOR-like protein 6 isoform X2 [Erythranthe guttata]|eukprot:XP_012836491.1 PREDICTED: EPIDERMAL PATTERNING FACTOR-like protein 6 isoform X2 [Erythranthe guttata]
MRATSICCFLVLLLHIILSLPNGGSTARIFHSPHAFAAAAGTLLNTKPLQTTHQTSLQGMIMKKRVELVVREGGAKREMQRAGSSPPSCEHKCYGCMPCEAIQVPTTTLQYTNYEPEGWKCKCGPTFYTP